MMMMGYTGGFEKINELSCSLTFVKREYYHFSLSFMAVGNGKGHSAHI
jgi:hypothetical protein